ncbi:DUF5056 domain-containing protein [Phocaeicola sp.]
MMENDDKLISRFMHANKHEIADNGFSRRVIRQLPERAKWLSDVLSICCALLCCILFYVFNGFDYLFRAITEIITSQSFNLISNTNFQTLLIATVVLVIIGVQRACTVKW